MALAPPNERTNEPPPLGAPGSALAPPNEQTNEQPSAPLQLAAALLSDEYWGGKLEAANKAVCRFLEAAWEVRERCGELGAA